MPSPEVRGQGMVVTLTYYGRVSSRWTNSRRSEVFSRSLRILDSCDLFDNLWHVKSYEFLGGDFRIILDERVKRKVNWPPAQIRSCAWMNNCVDKFVDFPVCVA